ncbi:MAG TPA: outer membrane lipoprotein-sorting protein [Bryobacteraceae bacterium]|nr:outer membrane lipoprotein-sorting protein [Bryobacteraceae bacterium]
MMRHFPAILATAALLGAADSLPLPLPQLTDRMAQMDQARQKSLERYADTRRYILDNKRFKTHAEMTVRMTYGSSGKKEFHVVSESGSPWVRKYVFRRLMRVEQENSAAAARRDVRISADNYEFRLIGTETANGRPCYLLDAVPKTRNKYLFRGRIWVDAEDAAVTRIEGSPAQLPSLWTSSVHFVHQFQKIGPYWLAASNVSETEVRLFGSTEIKVEYFDYVVNPPVRNAITADPPGPSTPSN